MGAWADWEAQMEAEWQANGGLMGMLGMTGEDLQMMMQMPSEEQMAEMEQGWMEMMSSMGMDPAQMEQAWAEWEAQMEEEWKATASAPPPTWPTARWPCPPCPWPPARSNSKDDKLDHWRRHWLLSISVGNSSREALFGKE